MLKHSEKNKNFKKAYNLGGIFGILSDKICRNQVKSAAGAALSAADCLETFESIQKARLLQHYVAHFLCHSHQSR